ncbi:hypothetical protein B0H13DRAFT_1872803 [Mycena leptocephala]|nr:hypothetical protein B0H13DRAFT_1872803 [Mycena leptocephala]
MMLSLTLLLLLLQALPAGCPSNLSMSRELLQCCSLSRESMLYLSRESILCVLCTVLVIAAGFFVPRRSLRTMLLAAALTGIWSLYAAAREGMWSLQAAAIFAGIWSLNAAAFVGVWFHTRPPSFGYYWSLAAADYGYLNTSTLRRAFAQDKHPIREALCGHLNDNLKHPVWVAACGHVSVPEN